MIGTALVCCDAGSRVSCSSFHIAYIDHHRAVAACECNAACHRTCMFQCSVSLSLSVGCLEGVFLTVISKFVWAVLAVEVASRPLFPP